MEGEQKLTALVVDDDKRVLEALERNLNLRGYEVKTARFFGEAKEYSDENFDLAIIDGLNGRCFEVYDIINAKRKFVLTGDFRIEQKAVERGIEAYGKPINLSQVLKNEL